MTYIIPTVHEENISRCVLIYAITYPYIKMPYTVNHFLEQVSQKLYDGSSFVRSPEHVLQASHVPYFANRDADIYKPFVEANLERLAFQEYSQDYAHERYTMGFGGRPGGTEFYISMQSTCLSVYVRMLWIFLFAFF